MREIKFRYWDEDNKTMYSLEEIQDLVKDIIPLKKVGYFFLDETIINMQYTGRVDVNGVEIYEGDIVEVTKSFIGTECFKQIGKVVFENGMFIVKYDTKMYNISEDLISFAKEIYDIKVIGNIYEGIKKDGD